jgi:hypothetical protein
VLLVSILYSKNYLHTHNVQTASNVAVLSTMSTLDRSSIGADQMLAIHVKKVGSEKNRRKLIL